MGKMLLLFLVLECSNIFAFQYPSVVLFFNGTPPSTVFYGETLRIPVQLNYAYLRTYKIWHIPAGSYLEYASGSCSAIPYDEAYYLSGICRMRLVIPGNQLGKVVQGRLVYQIIGKERGYHWDWSFPLGFHVTVIPHKLSMTTIMPQSATANMKFVYNIKSAIRYYDENVRSGAPVEVNVSPIEQYGLRFDKSLLAITGKPTQTGTYAFKVGAKNKNGAGAAVNLHIEVKANIKDKPVFKKIYPIAAAISGQKYTMNLMNLIEPQPGFRVTNQIIFRIERSQNTPDWLTVSKKDGVLLTGNVPPNMGGTEVELNLVATSNTGGDSEPLTIKIPIAPDPSKTPVINSFELTKDAGMQLQEDLSRFISDPGHDSTLQLILDKIEPDVSWINVSFLNPTVLEGVVPENAVGKKFMITLRASTLTGGTSHPVIIPLQINVDKEKTPYLKNKQQNLPLIYPGQSYRYDFNANRDVYPEYDSIPYEIKFASEDSHPYWLKIENNRLLADKVPEDIDSIIKIHIIIKNIPGGQSEPIALFLKVMK